MGGKNHQPCRSWLPESTKMSRALSELTAQIEFANLALEDAIITEDEGEGKSLSTVIERFSLSEEAAAVKPPRELISIL